FFSVPSLSPFASRRFYTCFRNLTDWCLNMLQMFMRVQPNTLSGAVPSFKERRPFRARKNDADGIRRQQPHKVPLIVERFDGERSLPRIDSCKFLVADHTTIAELMFIVRRRLELHPEQTFFLLANEKAIVANSMTLAQLYRSEKDADGFLYFVYASQPAFG
ncbi:hypothetical protein PFISCL1PPCAC_11905, partial [Pristionchus fissidentatus]